MAAASRIRLPARPYPSQSPPMSMRCVDKKKRPRKSRLCVQDSVVPRSNNFKKMTAPEGAVAAAAVVEAVVSVSRMAAPRLLTRRSTAVPPFEEAPAVRSLWAALPPRVSE